MEVNSLNAINNGLSAGSASPASVQPQRPVQTHSSPAEPTEAQRRQMQRLPVLKRIDEPEFIGERNLNAMMNRAFNEANRRLAPTRSELHIRVHDVTRDIMVVVKNSETGDVIREVPPEKVLDAIASAWEMAGLFVDEAT